MKDKHLQLLIHGENIKDAKVNVDYGGVSLTGSHSPGHQNYLVVDLLIDEQAKSGSVPLVFTLASGEQWVHPYTLNTRHTGSAERTGFSSKDVIYLIAPDRFANGNAGNDEVAELEDKLAKEEAYGRHGGDIEGISQHLDYIDGMGFTQIWTMPLLENAMPSGSYHGYAITDYYTIDPRFGSNQEYQQLSAEASKRGIGVIKDVVLNHIGSEHLWMNQMPSSDWINHGSHFTPTSHRREALHDPHGVQADKDAHAKGWFVPTMPDLNQQNPFVAQYLIQHAIWWIEYAGLSGLRVDTYSYSDRAFLSDWTKAVMREYPNLTIVGEEWSTNPLITSYWQAGSLRYDEYETALPSVMDFPLQTALISTLNNPESWDTGLRQLYELLASDFVYGDPGKLVIFADNHDMSRVATQLNENEKLWNMAMTILMTTRGIPQVFYGTELFMTHPGTDSHGLIRADFPGGFDDNKKNGFTGVGLTKREKFAQDRMRLLLNKRKNSLSITQGELTHYAPNEGIYVYFRHHDDSNSKVMVIVNKNDKDVSVDLTRFEQLIADKTKATAWRDGAVYSLNKALTVTGLTATVFTLD